MLKNLYLSTGLVSCFDDLDATDPLKDAANAAAAQAAAEAAAREQNKTFTQEEVNAFVAKEKRANTAALLKAEASYKQMLTETQNLSAKDRAMLEDNLNTVQGQLRTKEEQAKMERKQLEETLQTQISDAKAAAQTWETRFKTNEVDRSLQEAAVSADAFQPSQIVTLLKPLTKLVEDIDPKTGKSSGRYNAMVEFDDVDAEGQPTIAVMTPKDAVKRMKQLPEIYGNLFKSGVVSGIGANSATGVGPGSNGKVDLRKLGKDPAAYRKMRSENPGQIGLNNNHR